MKRSLSLASTLLVVSFLIGVSAHSAYGDTILTYTGNLYNSATGPYSTSDFVKMTIDLTSPLLSFKTQTVNPVSFTISDGVQTFTQSNQAFATAFEFSTDGLGDISSWFISAALISTQPSFAGDQENIILCRPSPIFCTNYYDRVSLYNSSGAVLVASAQNTLNGGSWAVSTSNSVPEPTTLALLTSLLAGLCLYSRRRKSVRT